MSDGPGPTPADPGLPQPQPPEAPRELSEFDRQRIFEEELARRQQQASDSPPADPAPSSRPRVPRVALIAVALLAALIVAAVAFAVITVFGGDKGQTITGSMTLTNLDDTIGKNESCTGSGGYDDIDEGTQVVVSNETGETLATGELGPGKGLGLLDWCTFKFTVEKVGNAKFYEIEVSHRGGLKYSKNEMEKMNWKVELTLGS